MRHLFFAASALASYSAVAVESGPMVGAVTHNSAKLWIGIVSGQYTAKYCPGTSFASCGGSTQTVNMTELPVGAENHARVILTGLNPRTSYAYAIFNGTVNKGEGYFRTAPLPNTGSKFTVALASCMDQKKTQGVWPEIRQHDPDFMILGGDNFYLASSPRTGNTWYDEVIDTAMTQRNIPTFADLIRRVPTFAIWDDHDYGPNNSGKTFSGRTLTLQANKDIWANPYSGLPATSGMFFDMVYGEVHFFFLDGRYHRDDNCATNGPAKSMFGAAQHQWLHDGLKNSSAKWKVLVTGTTWGRFNRNHQTICKDEWSSFDQSWREIFHDTVRDEKISGVVMFTGDIHKSMLRVHPAEQNPGFDLAYDLVEVISSGVENASVRSFATIEFDTTLSDSTMKVALHHEGGETVQERTFKLSDMKPAPKYELSLASVRAPEPGTGQNYTQQVQVHRSGYQPGSGSIRVSTRDGSAIAQGDYTSKSQILQFPNSGNATATFSVNINPDAAVEGDEEFFIDLDPSANGILGKNSTATVTIEDDDSNKPPVVSAGPHQYLTWSSAIQSNGVPLQATVTDDGQPLGSVVKKIWEVVGAPATVNFNGLWNFTSPTAFPPGVGIYNFRLTADDGARATSADTVVALNPSSALLVYEFDEDPGALASRKIARDYSGRGNDGWLVGEIDRVPGRNGVGRALDFQADSTHVDTGINSTATKITLLMRFKLRGYGPSKAGRIFWWDDPANGEGMSVVTNGQKRRVEFSRGGWVFATSDDNSVPLNEWVELAVTLDVQTFPRTDGVKLYINGVEQLNGTKSTPSGSYSPNNIPTSFHVGDAGHGAVDHFSFYNSILTLNEINSILGSDRYPVHYGQATAAPGKSPPRLRTPLPALRGQSFTLQVLHAPPNAGVILLLGTQKANFNALGLTVLNSVNTHMSGLVTDNNGQLNIPFTIPANSAPGTKLYFQALVFDGAAASGLTATDGMEMTVY